MIICTFDLASCTGYAYGRPDTTPACGAVRAPACGDELGLWGSFFWRFFTRTLDQLSDRLEVNELLLVAYESPVLIEKTWDPEKRRMVGGNPIATTQKLQGLTMLLETACAVHAASERIEIRKMHLSTIKKRLTGSGRADKSEMILAARRAGIVLPEGAEAKDAADAFGGFVLAIEHWAPEHLDAWLRRIHGQGPSQERLSAAEARTLFPRR